MKSMRFIKNIAFYFMGTFATKILQFFFIPLYTKYILTSDFGYYSLTLSLIALVVPLLYQSIWEGVLRFAIENEGDERKVMSTTTVYCFGMTFIYIILFLCLSSMFKIQYGVVILIMGISQMGVSYWQYCARALKKNQIYALSTVVNSAITIALNLILIIVFKWGVLALFVANSAGCIAMIIILEINLKLFQGVKIAEFDIKLLKSIIMYSFPLCVNAISWWLISSCNNLVISYRIGVGANGIYAIASRFGSIMTLVTSVVTMAWLEEAFRTYGDKDSDEYFNKVFDILIRVMLSGVLLLVPVTYVFYHFFVVGDYKAGVILTPIIYLSAAYSALAGHLGSAFLARKESDMIFRTSLISGVVSSVGAFVVAKPFGLMGVVISSLVGYTLMGIVRIPMLKNRMKLQINFVVLIGMTLLCFLIMAVCNINAESFFYQVAVFLVAAVIAVFVNRRLLSSMLILMKNR
jgi:O-antigen/teichoic acid export membrane protein